MEPTPNLAKPSDQNPLDSGSAIGTCRARAYVTVFLLLPFFLGLRLCPRVKSQESGRVLYCYYCTCVTVAVDPERLSKRAAILKVSRPFGIFCFRQLLV